MSKFKTGDRAMYCDEVVTVLAGEVQSYYGGDRAYLVERAGGGACMVGSAHLAPVLRFIRGDTALFEGYRVKVLSGPYAGVGPMEGKSLYLVEYVDGPDAGRVRTLAESSLLAADDSSYVEARYPRAGVYQSRDGGAWRFLQTTGNSADMMLGLGRGRASLFYVVTNFGPLIRHR